MPQTPHSNRLATYIAIEAANSWINFSRSYVLSSALGEKDNSGTRVLQGSSRYRTFDQALTYVIHSTNKKIQLSGKTGPWNHRDEPNWQDTATLLKLLQGLNASSYTAASVALSLPGTAIRDLPTLRNYYAHKSLGTARKVAQIARKLNLPTTLSACELMSSAAPGRPDTVILNWLDELRITVRLMS